MKVRALPRPEVAPRPFHLGAGPALADGPVADQGEPVAAEVVVVGAEADRLELDAVHTTVAALYVDPNGVYANLPGVEVWDEARDARLYAGPWPVVAHPPCARWCAIAHLVESRYGYRVGDDGGCFAAALDAVRTFGGILEHPAYSRAWSHFGLPRPAMRSWQETFEGEYVCEVDQHAYGFPGRKRTWLYGVRINPVPLDFAPAPNGLPVVSRWGWNRAGPHFRDEHHTIRPHKSSRTPEGLRDALLEAARRG